MDDLLTTDRLREKEYSFGSKITVEDASGNKLYFKLVNIVANPYEIQQVIIHAIYEGEERKQKQGGKC